MIMMCAISGFVGLQSDESIIQAMFETMHRRGPDEQGLFQMENVTLLHTRLMIVDPEGGKQPMSLYWAGEEYTLVYNGELYNTQEIRQELRQLGHVFQGYSDTEVVLHAYSEFGATCLNRFNGIFAFAVWEHRRKRLFLGRDRIGVKPLFYVLHEGGLLFASEMKTILKYPTMKAYLDETGVAQLLLLGPGRLPGSGVFRNIQELEPGCFAEFEAGKLHTERYWKLMDQEHLDSFEETSEKVRYLVENAIKRQMVSDVPIGTFLSGGLDSSIITAICAREMKKRGEQLPTFSVDYDNNQRYFTSSKFQPNTDDVYIEQMQRTLDTDHHWTLLTPDQLVAALEEATIARDLPGMADVDFSLLAFCKNIRVHVKAALSGECADEIFGGYPWYRDPEIRVQAGFPWAQNTLERKCLLMRKLSFSAEEFVMDAYQKTCNESDILPGTADVDRRMKEMVNLNFRWFMQTLLDRKDRMSMYTGLEVRVPFCDYRIAEYLYCVPWEYKDWKGREKGLLRHAVKDLLPEEILYRKKSPYPKTYDPRYEELVAARLEQLLSSDSPLWYIVNRNEAGKILTKESAWPWYGQLMRRPQTIAYLLQLDFWLKHYRVDFFF